MNSFHSRIHQEWLEDPEYRELYISALAEIVGEKTWKETMQAIQQSDSTDPAQISDIIEQVRLDGLEAVEEDERWLWESPDSFKRVLEGMIQARLGMTIRATQGDLQ